MVTLAVAAILAFFAVPGFQEFIKTNSLSAQANAFLADLHLARAEAIKRKGRVTMCKSSTLTSCATDGGWEQGWIIFADQADIGWGAGDASRFIVRTNGPTPGMITIRGNQNVKHLVYFLSTGEAPATAGTLIICDDRIKEFSTSSKEEREKTRAVVISPSGRLKIIKGSDSTLSSSITSCTPG